jgi:hypothetical protein
MRTARFITAATLVAASTYGAGCSKSLTVDGSSSIVIIDAIQAASGAIPTAFSGTLASDVQTMVPGTSAPVTFDDLGQVTFGLGLKDPGTPTSPAVPTTANYVTITSYHVKFVRSDGGTGVPAEFDGAVTVTIGNEPVVAIFTLVRGQAKNDAPLAALKGPAGTGEISTIVQITFHGTDQTGHAVTVAGQITVNFADWPDPVG